MEQPFVSNSLRNRRHRSMKNRREHKTTEKNKTKQKQKHNYIRSVWHRGQAECTTPPEKREARPTAVAMRLRVPMMFTRNTQRPVAKAFPLPVLFMRKVMNRSNAGARLTAKANRGTLFVIEIKRHESGRHEKQI